MYPGVKEEGGQIIFVKLLLLLSGMLLSSAVWTAQTLYKWTDKNGKVHYSDKKPEHKPIDQKVIKTNLPFGQEKASLPKKLISNESLNHVWLYFSTPLVNLERLGNKGVGQYFFGPDCVSPTSIRANNLRNKSQQSSVIPKSHVLAKKLALFLRKYSYPVSSSIKSSLKTDLRLKSGLVLTGEITNINLHLCAPKKSSQYFGKYRGSRSNLPENERMKVFSRQRGMVEVKWMLFDERAKSVLYQTNTRGVSNQWIDVGNYYSGFIDAARDAAVQLVLDKAFMSYLGDRQLVKSKDNNGKSSLFDWNFDNLNISGFKKRAILSQAMVYVSDLKVRLNEYYTLKGTWPDNQTFQTYLDNDSVLIRSGIQAISIGSDGSLVINLDSQRFGKDRYFSLHPEAGNYQMSWACRSNLSESMIHDLPCEAQ